MNTTAFQRTALLTMLCILSAMMPTFAARIGLMDGDIRSEDMAIVLATIDGVAKVERAFANASEVMQKGFRFRLKIAGKIRPGKMPDDLREVQIPFSASGYATSWEFADAPKDGMRVLACLKLTSAGKWEIPPLPGAVSLLKGFNDPVVGTRRKIVKLWEINEPAEMLKAVLAGCHDSDPEFQVYCVNVLQWMDGKWTGVDLSKVLDRKMALSHIWEVYTAPRGVSVEAISVCENVFRNEFRGQGWEGYPPRYEVLQRIIRQTIAGERAVQHNFFDYLLMDMCRFPEHAGESYRVLIEVIEARHDIYKFGTAQRFSLIYQPHASDKEVQKLNDEILQKLVQFLSHKNPSVAEGAALAIGEIAKKYAAIGPVPNRLNDILRGEPDTKINEHARSRLDVCIREIQATKPRDLPGGVEVLAFPWEGQLDNKVIALARICPRDGKHGFSVEADGRRLWVDGQEDWPQGFPGDIRILITGRLAKRVDLPVFRYQPGKPFGEGLPVPEGYEPERLRQRFVLLEATWEVCPPVRR